MANWWDDPDLQASKTSNTPKAQPSGMWEQFTNYVANQAAKGPASLAGAIGDAVANPVRDLGDIPQQLGEIYRGVTGQTTPQDAAAVKSRFERPGVVSGPIDRAAERVLPTPPAPNKVAKYAGAVARGVTSMGPFLSEGLPAVLSGAGMGAGGQAAEDLFPGSPVAPIVGQLIGGFAGGVAAPRSLPKNIVTGLVDRGLTPKQAQGVTAGIIAESRGRVDATNPDSGAFGYGQWLGSRKAELIRRYGPNPTHDEQLDFLVHELKGGDAGGPKVLANDDPKAVLKSYITDFMRPKKGKETNSDLTRGAQALGDNPNNVTPIRGDRTDRAFAQNQTINELNDLIKAHEEGRITSDELNKHLDEIDKRDLNAFNSDQTGEARPRDEITGPPENVLTPAEQQDMDASVPKQNPPEAVDARTIGQGADYPEQTPANDTNVVSLDQARDEKNLKDFHSDLMSQVTDRAEISRRLAQEAHDSGLLPMEVGDRFLTPKAQETGQGPWKIIGHYVDPKDPERYGYRVERGHEGSNDHESSLMLVSDPKADARLAAKGHQYDRSADVKQWKKLGVIRNLIDDDSGSLNLGKIFGNGKKSGGEEPRPERETPEDKLTRAVNEARPANIEQQELLHKLRVNQANKLAEIQGRNGSIAEMKAALKGGPPVADFQPLDHGLSEEEINTLRRQINTQRGLGTFDKLHAHEALDKLLDPRGMSPPTESQLDTLAGIFGPKFIRALQERVSPSTDPGMLNKIWNTVNAAKTIGDWSDLTKSNATMFLTPGYWKSVGNFVKGGFFGKNSYQKIRDITRSHPDYDLVRQMRISHTGQGEALLEHEEIFKQNLLEHVPVLKNVMNASERVYSGVANEVRDHAALKMIARDRKAGVDVTNADYLKRAGELVNTMTGRASFGRSKLGVSAEKALPFISKALWTPRQYASWVKMGAQAVNPKWWYTATPGMRRMMASGIISLAGWTIGNLTIASSLGYEVHKNILDPLFGKYKIGDTLYDASAGRGSTLHTIATAISGYTMKSGQIQRLDEASHGGLKTRGDVVLHWIRTHASPAAALIENEFAGKDLLHPINPVGHQEDWTNWTSRQDNPIYGALTPMAAEGTLDAASHYGWGDKQTYLTGAGEMLGRQANTQEPRKPSAGKKSKEWWDDPSLSGSHTRSKKEWWNQ